MKAIRWQGCRQLGWIAGVLLLSGCAGQVETPFPAPRSEPSVQRPIPAAKPQESRPSANTPIAPSPIQRAQPRTSPAQVQRSHPRYAPPPAVASHWDNRLGVYVLDSGDLYYRERLFYRYQNGWFGSGRVQGPWDAIAPDNVPPGLRSRY